MKNHKELINELGEGKLIEISFAIATGVKVAFINGEEILYNPMVKNNYESYHSVDEDLISMKLIKKLFPKTKKVLMYTRDGGNDDLFENITSDGFKLVQEGSFYISERECSCIISIDKDFDLNDLQETEVDGFNIQVEDEIDDNFHIVTDDEDDVDSDTFVETDDGLTVYL